MSFTSLPDNDLIALFERECKQNGLGAVDAMLCLELMRRAFVQKISEVFEAVERYYGKLFLYWVWSDPAFRGPADRWGNNLAADILQEAYANIMRALRKFADPAAFYAKFDSICRKFLGFVRKCIHSAVQDMRRSDHRADADARPDATDSNGDAPQPPRTIISLDDIPDAIGVAPNDHEARFDETLAYIQSILNKGQWPLFYCALVLDMRPREIANKYPELGTTARDITVALYAIRKLLKNDPGLGNRRD